MKEFDKLIKILETYKIVSFDIFDTLLLRNVQRPIDIFRIMEQIAEKKYNISEFTSLRVNTEQESRKEENNYETTLDEIYANIPLKRKKVKEELKQLELDLEMDFLVANPFMKKVYDYCVKHNKKILCISDMYLPKDFIQKVLEKNGYKNISLYISCEYNKHKGNGTLFEFVKEKENLTKERWIHIGDNYNSDYVQPKKFGINAYHYPKVLDRSDVNGEFTSVASSIINAIRNNEVNNGLDIPYWTKFGILNASPIYFAFANWVYKKNEKNDNVYFLARDGYIIKKVFDIICQKEKNPIVTKYLYASRRAVQLPMLLFEDKTYAIDTLTTINTSLNEKMKLKTVFEYFDMDVNKYIDTIKKYGFEDIDEEVEETKFMNFKQMISDLYEDFSIEMKNRIELIKEYLQQEGFDKFNRINVVDIGWRGSIQYALSQVVEKELFGYYFCTSPYVYYDIYYNTQGFLTNFGIPSWLEQDISKNVMLYEFLFSAPEGSLYDFKKENSKIVPILSSENEYDKNFVELQDAAINIIDKYLEYYDYVKDITAEEAVWPYRNFIDHKNYEDLLQFSKISTNVGYGGSLSTFVPVYSKKYVLEEKNKFLDEINKAMWNGTFLIKEIKTEEELNAFIDENLSNIVEKKEYRLFSLHNLILAIKHPKKAIRGIKILLSNKFKK